MDEELLKKIKKYIEKCEHTFMWEYSGHIVEDNILFADKKRMPELYSKIIKLISECKN